jgi:hypothetical protein
MTLLCPHCGRENRVAGYYPRPVSSIEGTHRDVIYCGHCGKKWVPTGQQVTEGNPFRAGTGTGTKSKAEGSKG